MWIMAAGIYRVDSREHTTKENNGRLRRNRNTFRCFLLWVAIFSLLGIYFYFGREDESKTTTIETQTFIRKSILTDNKAAFSSSDKINFTLKPTMFPPVPYFDRSQMNPEDESVRYKFLEDYVAVVEPSRDMELYLYDTANYPHYHLKFKVCNSGSMDECKEGTKYKFADRDEFSTSIAFECELRDEFDIEVSEIDATNSVVNVARGKGICLNVRRKTDIGNESINVNI